MRSTFHIAFFATFFLLIGIYFQREYVIFSVQTADFKAAAGVIAQIAATLAGFVLAALAVIVSVSGTRAMRVMKTAGRLSYLTFHMLIAVCCLMVLVFVGVALMISDILLLKYFFVWLSIFSLSYVVSVTHKFWQLLKIL